MCLDVCWLYITSLHGSSYSIFTPGVMSHFHEIAPYSDNIRACCGAIHNVFCPKYLPTVRLCIAPRFGSLGCIMVFWGAQGGMGPNC